MTTRTSVYVASLGIVIAATGVSAQQQGQGQLPSQFPLSLGLRERGSSVTPAFEGWYRDKDGTTRLLVGYFNRNTKQEIDIPVGPDNHIDPGGPDQGQPTHFYPGRQWGVFSIKAPQDLGDKKLTWTLVVNGFTNVITLHTKPDYILQPYEDPANKNTPPVLTLAASGPSFTGPPSGIAASYTANTGEPLTVTLWASDEGAKLNLPEPAPGAAAPTAAPPSLKWSLFRGPAAVTFDPFNPRPDSKNGNMAATKATFTSPGDYILRVQANDSTGEGGAGFQCCWTNAHVKVTVKGPVITTVAKTAASAAASRAIGPAVFVGEWELTLETPRGSSQMNLTVKDQGGKLTGVITGDTMPEPQTVTDVTAEGSTLVLKHNFAVQGRSIPMTIAIAPDGDHWKSRFEFGGGQFVVDGTAIKK